VVSVRRKRPEDIHTCTPFLSLACDVLKHPKSLPARRSLSDVAPQYWTRTIIKINLFPLKLNWHLALCYRGILEFAILEAK
jgi:hypothetical protein